ncbi:hypothetical protein SAMN04490220_3519 [Rhodococcus jostii]|uniref:Uncharacterized protein n=1 Tax=Rhodococcus jostii TaxID=132919 RepID=A0A1H4XYE5_RHOJO|nr:hypothetical protein SAMN04490220_3519 [Rhodococcus jostii]
MITQPTAAESTPSWEAMAGSNGTTAVCITAVVMTTKHSAATSSRSRVAECRTGWGRATVIDSSPVATIYYRSRISLGVQLRDTQIIIASFSACSSSLRTESR